MAKKTYIGVNSVARRVRRMYIGVNDVARKVRRAYIGVAGIARLFFTFGDLKYHPDQFDRMSGVDAVSSNYVVIASTTEAVAYDKRLTATLLEAPTTRTSGDFGGASAGEYHLFAGGYNGNNATSPTDYRYIATVDCYDGSLTKVVAPSLPIALRRKTGVSVGEYALFGGGFASYANFGMPYVTAYDSSLTQTAAANMFNAESPGRTWNYNHGIFVGGKSGEYSGSYYQNSAAAYDTSLTQTTWDYTYSFEGKRHCKAGKYALLGPSAHYLREEYFNSFPTVYTIDDHLTSSRATSTSPGNPSGMASAGEFGVIYSIEINTSTYSVTSGINVYDESLVRTAPFTLTNGSAGSGISFGDMALMGNGDIFAVE